MIRSVFLCVWPVVMLPLLVHFAWKEHPWLPLLWYHALCILTAQIGERRPSEHLRETGLIRWGLKEWIVSVAAVSLLVVLAMGAGVQVLKGAPEVLDLFQPMLPDPRYVVLLAVWSLLANPLLEEYYWRGVVQQRVGIACSALFFWLTHYAVVRLFVEWVPALIATLPVLGAGCYWGWMRRKHGSLWPCVITHFVADAAILWAAWKLYIPGS